MLQISAVYCYRPEKTLLLKGFGIKLDTQETGVLSYQTHRGCESQSSGENYTRVRVIVNLPSIGMQFPHPWSKL